MVLWLVVVLLWLLLVVVVALVYGGGFMVVEWVVGDACIYLSMDLVGRWLKERHRGRDK